MITPVHPRIERLESPRCIVTPHPEFTWELVSDQAGARQAACTIEVEKVLPGGATHVVWRSGLLAQPVGECVRYGGEPLDTRSDYRWRVKVRDAEGQDSEWSEWVAFETGVIAPDRISAQWIAGGNALRNRFVVGGGLVRARACVSGLGYYEFFCNGSKVSAAMLAPSYTDYDKRVEYEIIDLTALLEQGDNVCGFVLADGWWRFSPPAQARQVQAIAQITLDYDDGRQESIGTDTAWDASNGPFLPESEPSPHQLFDGVHLDLAWLQSGWCRREGPDPGNWHPAVPAGEGVGELVPTHVQPIRETQVLPVLSVTRHGEHLMVLDFGKNFTGWIRFRASSQPGDHFVVRHAELLHNDGRLNSDTLRSAKQSDSFRLAGHPEGEAIEPSLLYHGLRFAEIEGPVDKIEPESIIGRVIHTDLPVIGEVTTSDARINWLLDALQWTVRGNAMSVITDVCQRDERRGWLLDGFNAMKAGMLWYDMNALGRKWFEDMAVNQEPEGCLFGDTAPSFACWGRKEFGLGWQRAVVLLPMKCYEAYGDRVLLERAFPVMCRWADYVCSLVKNNLLPDNLCKHGPEHLCAGRRNNDIANNAMAVDVLRQVAEAGKILGEPGTKLYESTASQIAWAAHERWYNPNNGCYGGGENFSQANQIYALRFGICPEAARERAFARLVDDMMEGRGSGPVVLSGVGSLEHVPFVLSDFGRDDLVWQWLQRDEYPGYGFMQKHGATAIWERWEKMEYNEMNAHNHAGLTGVGVWLMERLVGIRVEPGPEPVFHLRPGVHLPLASLNARWRSRWGELRLAWAPQGNGKILEITIPPGCRADLSLHGQGRIALTSGKHEIDYTGAS